MLNKNALAARLLLCLTYLKIWLTRLKKIDLDILTNAVLLLKI